MSFWKRGSIAAGRWIRDHGTNDAQKTMGIIALALFTGTNSGAFAGLPPWLAFLKTPHLRFISGCHRIVWAWVLTLPVAGFFGYSIARCFMLGGIGR